MNPLQYDSVAEKEPSYTDVPLLYMFHSTTFGATAGLLDLILTLCILHSA